MMKKFIKFIERVDYWAIILLPFSVGISPALANTVIGIMVAAFFIKRVIKKEKLGKASLPVIVFGVFIAFGALSFLNTPSIKDSIHGMTKLVKLFMVFLICSEEVKDKKHLERIAASAALAIALVGIDALWQFSFGRDFIRGNYLQEAIGLSRATASFPGSNGLGVYLTALTPLVAGIALFSKISREKLLFFLAALLGCIGVYLSFSRGAGIGLFISFLFLGLVKKDRVITLFLILLLLIFPFVMPKNIREWAKSVNYNPVIMLTCQTRIGIYRNTLNMIKQHPFLGVGINTFSRNYGKYRLAKVEETNPTADGYYAHNNFLHMAGEVGLLGLGAFLVFLFLIFKDIWLSFRRNKNYFLRVFSISIFAALSAYLINGFTETNLYYSRIVMVFWFLLGLGQALRRLTYNNEGMHV